jgi:hypothetical protein
VGYLWYRIIKERTPLQTPKNPTAHHTKDPQRHIVSRCTLRSTPCRYVTCTPATHLPPPPPPQRVSSTRTKGLTATTPQHIPTPLSLRYCSHSDERTSTINPSIPLMTQTSLHYHPTTTTPRYVHFHAKYIPGEEITIQVPITRPLRTKIDVYRYILHNRVARETIHLQIDGMRLIMGYTIFLRHPLLRYPLILYPNTSDADFDYMLERLITDCLRNDLLTSWEEWHL